MKKAIFFIGIICILAIAGIYLIYSLTASSIIKAQLHIEKGQAYVNDKLVDGIVSLKKGDTIRTGVDSKAVAILYESILVTLESNTEITLDDLTKEHPNIIQKSGSTWNKLAKLAGSEAYTIKAGNSVASIRGTSFRLLNNKILVGDGQVEYKLSGKTYNVLGLRVVEIINGSVIEREANYEEKLYLKAMMLESIDKLRNLRNIEIEKHKTVISIIKKQQGWSDTDMQKMLDDADMGLINIDSLAEKSPIKTEFVDKIIAITKEIQKINQDIKTINASL